MQYDTRRKEVGMFFKKTMIILLTWHLPLSDARADTRTVDNCMEAALQAAQHRGLGAVLFSYLDTKAIAARAAWWRWRVRWQDISPTGRSTAIQQVKDVYRRMRHTAFGSVDLASVTWRTIPQSRDYWVTGSYRTGSREHSQQNWFDLTVLVTHATVCRVIRFSWNNVSLERYVAKRLPPIPP